MDITLKPLSGIYEIRLSDDIIQKLEKYGGWYRLIDSIKRYLDVGKGEEIFAIRCTGINQLVDETYGKGELLGIFFPYTGLSLMKYYDPTIRELIPELHYTGKKTFPPTHEDFQGWRLTRELSSDAHDSALFLL